MSMRVGRVGNRQGCQALDQLVVGQELDGESLVVGSAEHGDVGDGVDEQALRPHRALAPERSQQPAIGSRNMLHRRSARAL